MIRPYAAGDARSLVRTRARTGTAARSRRGAALIEFAFIALAFYLLLAGTFEMGRMIYASQALQNAARVGARELALMPAPATWTFDQLLNSPITDPHFAVTARVREDIYDPGLLVKDLTGLSDAQVQTELNTMPVLNRMLIPLMIRETVSVGGGARDLLRYPGALLNNPDYDISDPLNAHQYTVAIPRVVSRDNDGVETIDWVPVVEEVRADPNDPATGPFSMASTGSQRGLVALRINYPFQAATMTAFHDNPSTLAVNDKVLADDSGVTELSAAPGPPVNPSDGNQTYGGRYGLGVQYALGQEAVRPFRRLLSAQSMFRREVFIQ